MSVAERVAQERDEKVRHLLALFKDNIKDNIKSKRHNLKQSNSARNFDGNGRCGHSLYNKWCRAYQLLINLHRRNSIGYRRAHH